MLPAVHVTGHAHQNLQVVQGSIPLTSTSRTPEADSTPLWQCIVLFCFVFVFTKPHQDAKSKWRSGLTREVRGQNDRTTRGSEIGARDLDPNPPKNEGKTRTHS